MQRPARRRRAGATGVATSVPTNWGGGGGGGAGAELAVRLSVDHKPNLPEEAARVRAMGGDVRCVQGCWRVMRPGAATMLAVSRALGDSVLKPVVSCVPFTASRTLSPRDRFVLIASDGVWDVIDDDQAVGLAAELAGSAPGADRAAVPRAVAEGLVQAALRLGSTDNVTVLVVWLVWDG